MTFSYKQAGVDIEAGERAVELIRRDVRSTFGPSVLTEVGHFGGMFRLTGLREPVLVASADGVGTKVKIAIALNQHRSIGVDLVNHCVNDILTCGAKPLFFLDYLAFGKQVPEQVAAIVGGMAEACRAVGCALLGGETAEMPGVYAPGDYDVAGFIVGGVEQANVIDGKKIRAGDVLIGLPSSGLHTNGYSLARSVFGIGHGTLEQDRERLGTVFPELGRTLGEVLLEPHRCYLSEVEPLLPVLHGLAHITGGGLPGNLPRIIPDGLSVVVHRGAWAEPPIFGLIRRRGGIAENEMLRTFNLGIGMVLICGGEDEERVLEQIDAAVVIGEVVATPASGERFVLR